MMRLRRVHLLSPPRVEGLQAHAVRRRRAAARPLLAGALLLLQPLGCDGDSSSPVSRGGPATRRSAELDGGATIVARVGPKAIRSDTIGAIAAAQGIDPRAATDQAVVDALFALGAEQEGIVASPAVRAGLRGVLARATLHALATETARGAITDVELAAGTERRWLEVDRPASFRTVHAVAMLEEKADEAMRARAQALAARWREALEPIGARVAKTPPPSPATPSSTPRGPTYVVDDGARAFTEAVRAIDPGGVKITVEPLPPVACDGRVVAEDAPGQRFDPAFARTACALSQRGELSPVTASPFGFHVVMLLEALPAKQLGESERRRLLRDDILAHRAREEHRALVERLRARGAVELPSNVDALLRLVSTER